MKQPDTWSDIFFWERVVMCRGRLPQGYVSLKSDLGGIIKQERRKRKLKQQTLADMVGIARTSLSAIEANRVAPRFNTIDALQHHLDLEDGVVYVRAPAGAAMPRVSRYTKRDQNCWNEGQKLRDGRLAEGLTLRDLAQRTGLSIATLSRIESDGAPRSREWEDVPGYEGDLPEERPVCFKNSELQRLADLAS